MRGKMSYDQSQTAPPPAPEGYQQQYAPPPKPKKKPEEMISNGLILAVVFLSGILLLLAGILVHITGFLDDFELIKNISIVALILLDIAVFLLVVFMLLAAILRSDIHHWVRVGLIGIGAISLLYFLSVITGFSSLIP
ncbi:MAG: hypothetical protein ACE5IO_02480 [Thermoplasmata archaeon]